jgi:opine dehydrogenase
MAPLWLRAACLLVASLYYVPDTVAFVVVHVHVSSSSRTTTDETTSRYSHRHIHNHIRTCPNENTQSNPPLLFKSTKRSLFLAATSAEENDYASPIQVGIVGAGAIAFGTAALLAQNGHDPMLWSPSGAGTQELLAAENNNKLQVTTGGFLEEELQFFQPRVASTPQQLAQQNDILILCLPANGHVMVMDALAPYIRSGQHIIISSHASLGAVYFMQLLEARNENVQASITAWGTTIVTARKPTGTTVRINTIRKSVDICTVPHTQSQQGLALCQRLFGNDRFRVRNGLLAISLSNLNPQNHLGIALANMSRMERGETWSQGQNITPNVGRLLERLDEERLAIADVLGLSVRNIYEHFSLSFHVPMTSSVSEMNQQIVYQQGSNNVNGPNTAESRYVTEDVPYGLALIVLLGNLVGKPAVLHQAGMSILDAMYGREFLQENDLYQKLNLSEVTLEEMQEASYTGLLKNQSSHVTIDGQSHHN